MELYYLKYTPFQLFETFKSSADASEDNFLRDFSRRYFLTCHWPLTVTWTKDFVENWPTPWKEQQK